MNRKKIHLIIIFAVLITVGVLAACQRQPAEQPQEQVTPVSPAERVNNLSVNAGFSSVTAEGEVQPLRSANLSSQTGGQVAEVLVSQGDAVGAGDALIRLDAADLENALKQAEAGLAAAQAGQKAAEAQLSVAQSGIQSANSGITAAEAQLALIKAGVTDDEIAAAEQNLAAAEAAIVQAAGNRDAAVGVSDARVQAAQAKLIAAQADVDNLQEAYDKIIDTCFDLPDGGEICPLYGPVEENTRFQLEAAKANLAAAQSALEEAKAGATPAERQLANTGVGIAMARRDQAQAQLDLLLAGPRDEQIQQAEVGVLQAKLGLEQAQVQVAQAESAITQAMANVTMAEANVTAAQKALDRMTIKAPFAGTVGDILTEVGELIGPGVPAIRLADFGGWIVKTTDLTELDIVGVKNGLPAEVRVDAIPGEVIPGTVTDISFVPNLVRGDVTYEVEISLDESDAPLRWGMTATVDIDTGS